MRRETLKLGLGSVTAGLVALAVAAVMLATTGPDDASIGAGLLMLVAIGLLAVGVIALAGSLLADRRGRRRRTPR